MCQIESGVAPNKGSPQPQLVYEPVVLWISIVVLCGAQGVGYTLYTVHYRARKVVGGVNSGELSGVSSGGLRGGKFWGLTREWIKLG